MNPAPVTVTVPAKINLQLSIGPLQPNGYHDIVTVFQALDLVDTIEARPATDGVRLQVVGEGAESLPTNSNNLAVRAAQALARFHGIPPNVDMTITKRIPIAGGMAGGSADAAGALVACDYLWELGTPREHLDSIAASLGSDVTFCLHGGTAIGTGRGETLTPVLSTGEFHWVIAFSHGELSTPKVYAECDRLRKVAGINAGVAPNYVSDLLINALRSGDSELLASALSNDMKPNDLQPAAISLKPDLQRVLDTGLELGALAAMVSGSGPTCVFLASSQDHAFALAAELSGTGVCRTVRTAKAPAPGAKVQR